MGVGGKGGGKGSKNEHPGQHLHQTRECPIVIKVKNKKPGALLDKMDTNFIIPHKTG